jgi:apolipoprotein N-acyltransferase
VSAALAGPAGARRVPRGPGWRPWNCALASGALLVIAGRPWGLGWLALVAFVPLLAALRSETSGVRAGLLVAVTASGAAFVVVEALGPLAPALVPPLAAVSTLPFAASGALAPRLRRALGARALLAAFPLLWLAAEALPGQGWLLGRFAAPLFAVGYSQAGLPTMQLARLGGVAAVGLAVVACNALLALALVERAVWAPAGLAALAAAVSVTALTAPPPPAVRSPTVPVAGTAAVRVVQRALPDAAYAAAAAFPAARAALVRGFVAGARAAPLPGGPGLTIAPEGALPGPLPDVGRSGLEPWLEGLGPALLGGPARVPGGVANAAFAWRRGSLERVYAKRRLAPVTEADLVPGRGSTVVTIGGVRVAPLICFEAAFPGLARQAANEGAQLLAVLTNDAFGRYLGTPLQHLRLARFRAVETGRPLAFASNAGPSAVIDGAGRVLARTGIGRRGAALATPRLDARPTPFLRWGDWPGTFALVGSVLLALVAGAKGGPARS